MRIAPLLAAVAMIAACGLDARGLATDDDLPSRANGADASANGADAVATASCEPAGSCGVAVESGFEVVAFAMSRVPCPDGLIAEDVVAQPSVGAGACTCGACATVAPDCGDPVLQTHYDNTAGATCDVTGFAVTGKNGVCTAKSSGFSGHSSVGVTATTKGACTANASPNLAAVTVTLARICSPKPGCGWPGCSAPPSPLAACLAHGGDVSCPASAPNKTLVGSDFALACGACACSVSAKCPGDLTFYDDSGCTQNPRTLAADGVCVSRSGSFGWYRWFPAAPTDVVCTASSPPAGAASLVDVRTICCP